jgi:hypothetical protein
MMTSSAMNLSLDRDLGGVAVGADEVKTSGVSKPILVFTRNALFGLVRGVRPGHLPWL